MTVYERRTDACLKACEGISTQNLEDNVPFLELARRYNVVLRERDALRAKIERMEQQEPIDLRFPSALRKMWASYEIQHWIEEQGPLYALPGAQPAAIRARCCDAP